jgi:hypothetical protein
VIDGDRVHVTGVRNFDYRSREDFTARYEERDVLLSHLTHLDFYVSYWSEGLVGHTFLSFIVPELHLRQRNAAEHLHRGAAGGGRGLRPPRVQFQAV